MKKRKTRAQRSRSFRCPHCGAAMILRPASEIYHDAKSDRKLYVCHNYPACNTYVAAHPNTDKPMGVPANGNLRNLRIQAHRKFDLTPIEDLPKISDITMHPPSVYMMLTGEYDESKTEDDVLQKLIEIAVGNLMEKEDPAGQRIRYVDTPLVEAIRHGYVCELQEPSCIANPGVLVGLNSLLDNCQVITLPTGERVRRHPDTVIVVTTNSDYSGCRDMNQSVISRMDLIYDMEAPDLNTMVKRVMNVTGFTDEQEATKMAIVVRDIAERCRQTMITDGSCGMREFKSWVLSTMVTNDPYESALSTIISSASADPDNRAELISACLEPQYSKTI